MQGKRTIKILLIESEEGELERIQDMLSSRTTTAFHVVTAGSLNEALARLSEEQFSVALVDLLLPDVHGLSAVNEIQSRYPHLPVVVVGGADDDSLAVQAVQSGAQDYLVRGRRDSGLLRRAIRYAIERKQTEERLAHLAQYDHLTGLANRSLFNDRLKGAIARADRNRQKVGLIFLDLDLFKNVNDQYGHDAGDRVLKAVGERLLSTVRKSDTVARLGGDEFAIVLEGLIEGGAAGVVAQKIVDAFQAPFEVDGDDATITCSIGISVYPHDDSQPEHLLQLADAAMYRAKQQGRNTFSFYTPDLNALAFERVTFRADLERAMKAGEFLLRYQPQIDLESGVVIGVEALIRWDHPMFGLVLPGRFIPIAEDTGLIVPLGEWVIQHGLEELGDRLSEGGESFSLAINVSLRQLRERDFAQKIDRWLEDAGVSPEKLILELSERALSEPAAVVTETIRSLHEIGVRLAIDNYGQQASSLMDLKRLPIQLLKAPGTLLRDVPQSEERIALLRTVHQIGEILNLDVIVEGVERAEQVEVLREMGCRTAQGYYFSRAVPAADIPRRVGAHVPA